MILTARVGQGDVVADAESIEQIALDPQGEAEIVRGRLGRSRRGQPNVRRSDDATEDIAIGRQSFDPPARPNRARAELGTRQIGLHAAAAPDDPLRTAQVFNHREPGIRTVVGAVDAHDIHPGDEEILDQLRIRRGFARHGHHDANEAVAGLGTQKRAGVIPKQ